MIWPFKKRVETAPAPIPYCEDCKFFRASSESSYDNCVSPRANPRIPVRRDQDCWAFCQQQRSWSGHCEKSGRWFEPKPPGKAVVK